MPKTGAAFGVAYGLRVGSEPCDKYLGSSFSKADGHACIKFRSKWHKECTCDVQAACETGVAMPVDSDDEKLELSMEVKEPKPPTECNGVKMAPGLQKCGTRCDYGKYLKNVRFVQVPSGMDAAGVGLGGRR
jgi:hypothetical protein